MIVQVLVGVMDVVSMYQANPISIHRFHASARRAVAKFMYMLDAIRLATYQSKSVTLSSTGHEPMYKLRREAQCLNGFGYIELIWDM